MQEIHQKELVEIAKVALKPYGFKKTNAKWTLAKGDLTFIFTISKSWGDRYNIFFEIVLLKDNENIIVLDYPIQKYINDNTMQYFVNFHPPYNRTETYKEDLQLALFRFGHAVKKIESLEDLKKHLTEELKIESGSFSGKARSLFFDEEK